MDVSWKHKNKISFYGIESLGTPKKVWRVDGKYEKMQYNNLIESCVQVFQNLKVTEDEVSLIENHTKKIARDELVKHLSSSHQNVRIVECGLFRSVSITLT